MACCELLFAEDDPTLRSLYVTKFSLFGYTIRTAEDGEQTVREILTHAPDLLLCDLNMPKMNGIQVLQYFPRNRRTFPIIVLTNYDDEESRATARELGADDYVDKKYMTIKSLVDMVVRITTVKTALMPAYPYALYPPSFLPPANPAATSYPPVTYPPGYLPSAYPAAPGYPSAVYPPRFGPPSMA